VAGQFAIDFDAAAVADFCRRHHIRELSLFGSILRDDFTDLSDVDVLVDFEDGHTPGWEIVDMKDELERLFRRRVDLLTMGGLRDLLRERILGSRRVIYDAA
jgi:predicted nucleotidyltransferase